MALGENSPAGPSRPRQVIMCGGPADGRWMTVDHNQHGVDVLDMPHGYRWTPGPEDEVSMPRRVRYDIRPIMILGHDLWIGIAVDDAYDDRAVMRAILQRDVAAHLGAYR